MILCLLIDQTILQSVLGINRVKADNEEDNDNDDDSLPGLLTALKIKSLEDAKIMVNDIIQPSLKRSLVIFLRGKKEKMLFKDDGAFRSDVEKTHIVANEFLQSFANAKIEEDEYHISKTNSVLRKFKFEKDINY